MILRLLTRTKDAMLARRDAYVGVGVTVIPFIGLIAGMTFHREGLRLGPVEISLFLVFYTATIIGVEVGYHRFFSHGAFKAGTRVRVALAILGSMSFQGPVIWWAASHRRHHKYADKPDDPHSPHFHGEGTVGLLRGLLHAHMGWLFLRGTLFPTPGGYERFVLDLLRDRALLFVHFNYVAWLVLSLAAPPILGGLLTWSLRGALLSFIWAGLVRIFFVNHSIWAVNSLCHTFGRRALRAPDRSTNLLWLALPSFGASWHNNHHAFARTAVNSFEWWQIDLGGGFVRVLERLGVVWDVKMPTRAMIESRRAARDGSGPDAPIPEDHEIAPVQMT